MRGRSLDDLASNSCATALIFGPRLSLFEAPSTGFIISSSNNEKDTSHATRTQERFYRINEGWLKELIGKENNKNNPACHCVRTFLWLSLCLSLSVFLCLSYYLPFYFSLSLSLSFLLCVQYISVLSFLSSLLFSHIHISSLQTWLLRLHFFRATLSLILTFVGGTNAIEHTLVLYLSLL